MAEEETEVAGCTVSPPPVLRRPSLPVILHKERSLYVDVDCRDENGLTPLILAALNGMFQYIVCVYVCTCACT